MKVLDMPSSSFLLVLVLVIALEAPDVATAAEGGPEWNSISCGGDHGHPDHPGGPPGPPDHHPPGPPNHPPSGPPDHHPSGPPDHPPSGPPDDHDHHPSGPPDHGHRSANASSCVGTISCPVSCPNCTLSCDICGMLSCPSRCDGEGSVCEDPKFIGGDGVMFYFHGYKDRDFCIISDKHVHVNAHFIGKRPEGRTRDFTWVQALTFLWEGHRLYVGAKKTKVWDSSVDRLEVVADGKAVEVGEEAWRSFGGGAGATIRRTTAANGIELDIDGILSVSISVVPITQKDSRVHGYGIGPDDCFAHLEIGFDRLFLSSHPTGVLGQTYAPGFVNPVRRDVPMPIMGGAPRFLSSSLYSPDCPVSRFTSGSPSFAGTLTLQDTRIACTTSRSAGFVCRK